MSDDDFRAEETLRGDDRIVAEAKRRFRKCENFESVARTRFINDVKFVNGDTYNHYQWPDNIWNERDGQDRPCLTVNKTKQHCLQITNDAKQNKTSVKIRPVGDQATFEAAQIYEGIVRRIEYISNAQAIYDNATRFQVWGGIGYWRVVTDYLSADTFDQEIFLRPIPDPLMVYLDPDIREMDGSDARFGFVFRRMSKDEFKAEYPDRDLDTRPALGNDETWETLDQVVIAEYFRKSQKKDKLISYVDQMAGERKTVRLSEVKPLGKEAVDLLLKDPETRVREIFDPKIEWFKIIGDDIAEKREWPGSYIPIVRVIGEETVIDGELDRKGHVRALIDAQKAYNYNVSANIEYGALQTKSPYKAAVQAIEGLETYWETANTVNHAVLPYNHKDDDGQPIPPPEREQPPIGAPAYIEGMKQAAEDMQLVSGQYEAEMGAPSNEKSGVAIQQRQRQGDRATYHYIDNLAMAIRFTGKIIIDLAPKIYDTPRVIKILQDDGSELHVQVDPNLPQAHQQAEDEKEGLIQALFNPSVGNYEIQSDVGPDFATRRQEAFNALSQIAAQNKELMTVIGDLVLKAADFPFADEAAERIKRLVPPQALGEGPTPMEQQLQAQLQAAHALLQKMTEELSDAKSKARTSDEKRGVDEYRAITERLDKVLAHIHVPAVEQARLAHQVGMEALKSGLSQDEMVTQHSLSMEAKSADQDFAAQQAEQAAQQQTQAA